MERHNVNHKVTFRLEGPGLIAGVDNGDPTCHEAIKASEHSVFHGLCLAVVRAEYEPGTIKLTATAQGLESAAVSLTTSSVAQ